MKKSLINSTISSLAIASALGFLFLSAAATRVSAQDRSRGWRVWIREEPCSGRLDWLTVAKSNPTGGGNHYVSYETVMRFANPSCSQPGRAGCTFAQAMAVANSLHGRKEFFNYCCRDYSVWENSQTGERSVVKGQLGTAGYGWRPVKTELCCEEAEAMTGKTGLCAGTNRGTRQSMCSGFGGSWDTPYGPLSLVVDGGRVTGNYSVQKGPGRIIGTLRGNVVEGEWIQPDRRGRLRFTLADNGSSFSGRWWEADGTYGGLWDGKCTGGEVARGRSARTGGGVSAADRRRDFEPGELPGGDDHNKPRASNPPRGNAPAQSAQPAPQQTGSLRLVGPEVLGRSRKESYNAIVYMEWAYSPTSVILTDVGDPPNRRVLRWDFSGMPASLSPGQEFTITITGSLQMEPVGRDMDPPASAGVRVEGLDIVSQQHAYISMKNRRDGKYVFRVPAGATSAKIEIGADYGGGTFAIYRYVK